MYFVWFLSKCDFCTYIKNSCLHSCPTINSILNSKSFLDLTSGWGANNTCMKMNEFHLIKVQTSTSRTGSICYICSKATLAGHSRDTNQNTTIRCNHTTGQNRLFYNNSVYTFLSLERALRSKGDRNLLTSKDLDSPSRLCSIFIGSRTINLPYSFFWCVS